MPKRFKAYLYLLSTVAIWGLATVVIKLTLGGIDPIPFLLYRFAISAGIACLYFITKKKGPRLSSQDITMFLIYAILGTSFGLGLLFIGLDETTVLSLSLITLSGPLLAQIAGYLFLREHLTRREKIGTSIAFVGTLITIVQPILNSTDGLGTLHGNLLILVYMIGDTVALILLKKLLQKGHSASDLTHGSFVVGFFSLLPVSLFVLPTDQIINQIISLPPIYHLGVLYMAVLSGTVAYWARAKGQKTIEVGEAALFGYLTPVVSSVLAVLVLSDKINITYAFGALIILFGVVLAETKHKRV